MVSKKKFTTIAELQLIQYYASKCSESVGLHSADGRIIVDAKSYIGIYSLDFSKPVLVVSESAELHEQIKNVGENVD